MTGPRSFAEVLDSLIASGSTALKRCYQCDKLTDWLAPDSRCSDCTRFVPEDLQ